ncbi:MAG: hypothetical protein J3T61_03150 [Candidatus Brocadiales bacterium]|nr:hypothetical protein [Candidatus Bathyanammoxibius sp.]
MVQHRFELPEELHRSFKIACVAEGKHMRDKMVELVREYVEKQEKKKGK